MIGPKVTVEKSCYGCGCEKVEHYAVQGDSGCYVNCMHPAVGKRRVGNDDWTTPSWCPAEVKPYCESGMSADGSLSVEDAMRGVLDLAAEQTNRCVVRLRTTTWRDSKGLHSKKSITFLRRQCVGFNGLEEDAGAIGAGEAIASIVNLDECNDGIYEAVVCDVSHDWETGHADDWRYKLVPISAPNIEDKLRRD